MSFNCAWCRVDGATRKVPSAGDGSVECYRYFCNTQHQANWETNQPRPNARGLSVEAASFFELAKDANLNGWHVLNCFQYGTHEKLVWRVNLQKRRENGATTDYYTEYSDDADPRLAMKGAYAAAHARDAVDKKRGPKENTTPTDSQTGFTTKQETRLIKALDNLFFAVKMDGTGSKDRTSDL